MTRADRPLDPNRPKIGANWTPEEEQQLRDGFAAHKPIPELATAKIKQGRRCNAFASQVQSLKALGSYPNPAIRRLRLNVGSQVKGFLQASKNLWGRWPGRFHAASPDQADSPGRLAQRQGMGAIGDAVQVVQRDVG